MTHAADCGCTAGFDAHADCTKQFCRAPLHSACTSTTEPLTAAGPPAFIQKKIDAKKAKDECDEDDEECKKKAKAKKGKAPFPGAKNFSAEEDGEYDHCDCGQAEDAKNPDCECDEDAFAAKSGGTKVDPRGEKLTRWRGLIAPIGKPTGDGRQFADKALTHRDLPLALRWHRNDSGGHNSVAVIGTVDEMEYREDGVYAGGIIFDPDPAVMPQLAEDVAEARMQLKNKVIGPSVDLDDMEFTVEEPGAMANGGADDGVQRRPKINVTKGRTSGVTMVQIPAFSETHGGIELYEVDAAEYAAEQDALVSSAVSPVYDGLEVWSVSDWTPAAFTGADENTLLASCVYQGDEGLLFPIVDEVQGQQVVVMEAVTAALGALRDGAVPEMSPADRWALTRELERLLEPDAEPAAIVAGAAPVAPPVSWFTDPGLNEPTPLTITEDGRIFGHLATWGTCHVGFPGSCVTPPHSSTQYAYFHVGETLTAEGQSVPVGKITVGPGHADTRLGFQAAAEHYDSSGACAAVVRAGEDGFGIWVAGSLTPECSETKLAELRRSPLSGDWRNVGGRLELVAALAVNTPGFPVPRVRQKNGRQVALVAAGALHVEDATPPAPQQHTGDLARDVARTLRRMDRAESLAATVGGAFALSERAGRALAATRMVQGRG